MNRKDLILATLAIVLIASTALAGCALPTAPPPEVIKETVVVEEEVVVTATLVPVPVNERFLRENRSHSVSFKSSQIAEYGEKYWFQIKTQEILLNAKARPISPYYH